MTPDLSDLEQKARAATPGPWTSDSNGAPRDSTGAMLCGPGQNMFRNDAAFIAAANPKVILALLEERKLLLAVVEAFKDFNSDNGENRIKGSLARASKALAALEKKP